MSEEARQEFINSKMREYAANIDEFTIGQVVYDNDLAECSILKKSINSINVAIKAKAEEGIDSTQWFDMRNFNDRFSKDIAGAEVKKFAKELEEKKKVAQQGGQPKQKGQQQKKQKDQENKSSLDQFMEGKFKTKNTF